MAASLLLGPSVLRAPSVWTLSLRVSAALAAALSLSALTGLSFGLKGLRDLAADGGLAWSLGMGTAAVLVAAGALQRPASSALTTGMLRSLSGFLVANLVYAGTVAPGSAAGRGEALAEFSAAVRKERRGDDELRIYGRSITNGFHYYLGLNEPAVPSNLLPGLLDQLRSGRLLLATNTAGSSELQREWPDRFEVVARLRQGRKTEAEHVLLALRHSESGR